jgi:hypothetical protein
MLSQFPAEASAARDFAAVGESEQWPKSSQGSVDRPRLIVDPGDLPATARELRDLFAASGRYFDRGVPAKIVPAADGGAPTATQLAPNGIVREAHQLCRPVKVQGDEVVPVTLPERVGRMYLHLSGEWGVASENSVHLTHG